jgi:acyl-CoA dehydrogenase
MEAVPYSEPPWLNGHPSPYYNDSHREWQRFCRQYISENLTKYAMQWENEGAIPDDIYGTLITLLLVCHLSADPYEGRFSKDNMLIPNLPAPLPVEWLKRVGIEKIGPVSSLRSSANGRCRLRSITSAEVSVSYGCRLLTAKI